MQQVHLAAFWHWCALNSLEAAEDAVLRLRRLVMAACTVKSTA